MLTTDDVDEISVNFRLCPCGGAVNDIDRVNGARVRGMIPERVERSSGSPVVAWTVGMFSGDCSRCVRPGTGDGSLDDVTSAFSTLSSAPSFRSISGVVKVDTLELLIVEDRGGTTPARRVVRE